MRQKRNMNMTSIFDSDLIPQERPPRKPKEERRKRKKRRRTGPKKKKLREFHETRLGYFIQHEAPLEYNIIMEVSGGREPNPDMIEGISYASLNPFFKKPKFRRALIEYRKNGCHTNFPKKADAKIEMLYIQKRRKLNSV